MACCLLCCAMCFVCCKVSQPQEEHVVVHQYNVEPAQLNDPSKVNPPMEPYPYPNQPVMGGDLPGLQNYPSYPPPQQSQFPPPPPQYPNGPDVPGIQAPLPKPQYQGPDIGVYVPPPQPQAPDIAGIKK